MKPPPFQFEVPSTEDAKKGKSIFNYAAKKLNTGIFVRTPMKKKQKEAYFYVAFSLEIIPRMGRRFRHRLLAFFRRQSSNFPYLECH